jgi:hypothetical protein
MQHHHQRQWVAPDCRHTQHPSCMRAAVPAPLPRVPTRHHGHACAQCFGVPCWPSQHLSQQLHTVCRAAAQPQQPQQHCAPAVASLDTSGQQQPQQVSFQQSSGGPSSSSSSSPLTFEEVQRIAAARGLHMSLRTLGPLYRITCRDGELWRGPSAAHPPRHRLGPVAPCLMQPPCPPRQHMPSIVARCTCACAAQVARLARCWARPRASPRRCLG